MGDQTEIFRFVLQSFYFVEFVFSRFFLICFVGISQAVWCIRRRRNTHYYLLSAT